MTIVNVDTLPIERALAQEAALLDAVAAAPDRRFLWLWESPQALVAPKKLAAKPEFAAAAKQSKARGWPVSIRSTGGDVTPQGPGVANVTHVYAAPPAKFFDIAKEYDALCSPIERALGPGASRGWMDGAFCDGAYNVQWNNLKFAGTAMRFRPCREIKTRYAVLAHALMLIEPPTKEAISAINALLSDLGEERTISLNAHTGLSDPEDRAGFLARLSGEFRALGGPEPEQPTLTS
ncbi:MAG: protein ligase [Pseudomonadota bacterium]